MRRRSRRHPYIETAVFAAALLLAAFIARELWIRRPPALAEPGEPVLRAAVLAVSYPPLPGTEPARRTEQAVTGVAPVKLARVQRTKPKPRAVPAPR